METRTLRVVHIDDQRWVVRTVRRTGGEELLPTRPLRFFNGAESRYVADYPADWPHLPESEITSLFARAERSERSA